MPRLSKSGGQLKRLRQPRSSRQPHGLGLELALTHVSSFISFGFFFWPKRWLDCASSLVSDVGEDAGPVKDAALSSRQSLLCFLELAFCKAHTLAPGFIEL